MAKYVPPSKRAGYIPSSSDLPPGNRQPKVLDQDLYSTHALSTHFTHPQDSTFTFFSYNLPPPNRPAPFAYDPTRTPEPTPLPPSPRILPRHPLDHIISYIVLFPNAHPDWDAAREIWTHSNADKIIVDYWKDGMVENQEGEAGPRRNVGRPIPVFQSAVRRQLGEMVFLGWFQVDKIRVVSPGSDELRDLLHRKEAAKGYARSGRTKEAWASALSDTWVKLRLSPSPPTSIHYDTLQHPMKVSGGADGEIQRYMLDIGGLTEEMVLLDSGKETENTV